jgi:uncharacterized protein YuzE
MRLSYDEEVGAAYLRLRTNDDNVGTVSCKSIIPPGAENVGDRIVLDFDHDGRLVGIEFLTPQERLLRSILAAAQRHP